MNVSLWWMRSCWESIKELFMNCQTTSKEEEQHRGFTDMCLMWSASTAATATAWTFMNKPVQIQKNFSHFSNESESTHWPEVEIIEKVLDMSQQPERSPT